MNNNTAVNLKILALDDDPVAREYIRECINSPSLKLAASIKEFLEILDNFRPDVFLLDVNLPDGNGIELCRNLKKSSIFRESFFIILTAKNDFETIEAAYNAGADDYFRKPFIQYEFVSKLKIMGNIKSARQTLLNAYQGQLDQNVQLLRLSEYIKRTLGLSDIDSVIDSVEIISDIIDVDYLEIVKVKNEIPLGISQKQVKKDFDFIPFKELMKQGNILKGIENGIKFFKSRKQEHEVYASLFSMKLKNTVYGYIIIERDTPFSHKDREIISLYIDYINLLSENISSQNELKSINASFKKEINIIRKLEISMLPDFSVIRGYDTSFSFMPAEELSGDFFDGFFLDEDTYQIVLCDVSGHGMASSYIGNQIRTLFREKSSVGKRPSEIARDVNMELFKDIGEYRFYCTAQIVQIFFDTDTILFLSAGHPAPVLCRNSFSDIQLLKNQSPVIGMFEDETYRDDIIKLSKDDVMFLYTDGLTEEHSADSLTMYGVENVVKSLESSKNLSSDEILHHCLGDFYEFNGYRPQSDDITLICIRKL